MSPLTSYYTDLYILLKVGYTRKSNLCAGITLCKMASQNPHGTQSSTVCYCRIVYNATLPCQCNIGLLYFLNLYGNTPPLQPTLLDCKWSYRPPANSTKGGMFV